MKILPKAVAVLLNVVVLVVLLEVGGNIFFLAQNGHLFYTRERLDLDKSREPNPFMSGALHGVVHPYFGYTYKINPKAGGSLQHIKLNKHGFMFNSKYEYPGCCEYPSVRHPDEIFVGIFGGSVAGGLAYQMQDNPALVDAIRAIPRFAGKQIRILPFAVGGYKQPQQLMVLAYYLSLGQPLDVVINVDGFNELLSGAGLLLAGIDVGYPDASMWLTLTRLLDSQALASPEGIATTYHANMRQHWARRANDCPVAICYSFAKLLQHWHQSYSTDSAPTGQASPLSPALFHLNPAAANIRDMAEVVGGVRVVTGRAAYDIVADYWLMTSHLMQQLARSRNIIYIHALQPNQWFRRSSPYVPRGPEETTAYLKKIVPIGYSAVVAKAPKFRELDVNFLDTSALLDNEPSSIYSDDVGHLTPRGYDLLADAIIKALAAPDIR